MQSIMAARSNWFDNDTRTPPRPPALVPEPKPGDDDDADDTDDG